MMVRVKVLDMPQIMRLSDLSLNLAVYFFLSYPESCPTLNSFYNEFSPKHPLEINLSQEKSIPANAFDSKSFL